MSDKLTPLENAQQQIDDLQQEIEQITIKQSTLLNTLVDALIHH